MINLVTGATGSGKSCFTMSELLSLVEEGRPLFVHGIPDLKIPHTEVICTNPLCTVCEQPPVEPFEPDKPDFDAHDMQLKQYSIDYHNYQSQLKRFNKQLDGYTKRLLADQWHIWAPKGALIIYDEVHYIYPPCASSAKQKPSVVLFSTHRHYGLDFHFMTQTPLLFDRAVKLLVGKHTHLRSTWAGRFQYEFDQVQDNVKSLANGVKSRYKLNTKVFDLYKSSSLHTNQKRKIPVVAFILVLLFFFFVFMIFTFKSRMSDRVSASQSVESVSNDSSVVIPDKVLLDDDIQVVKTATFEPFVISDISRFSFVGVDSSEVYRLPKYCSLHTAKSYKCYFPENEKSTFKSTVCFSFRCFTLISINFPASESYISS